MTNRSHTCIRPHRARAFDRALLGAASAGLILAALLPLCTMGILNYGSLAIWAVAVPGLLIALFPRAARALCARLWAHTPGRVLLRTAAGLLAAALLYCTAVTGAMLWCCAQRPAADDDPPLIVLGCQVYAAGPSPMLTMRLRAAEKDLAAHPNAMAVVSGGQGDGEPHADAEVMRFDARAVGSQTRANLQHMRTETVFLSLDEVIGVVLHKRRRAVAVFAHRLQNGSHR